MTGLNIIAFIFALIGAGLSIFQPVISIPSFGAGYNFGGENFLDLLSKKEFCFLDMLMNREFFDLFSDKYYYFALEIFIIALFAILYGFCTLTRTTKRQHIIGLSACSIWIFVHIGFFLSNTNPLQRLLVSGIFSYQKTFLIWGCCYAISTICAYLDKSEVNNQNTSINSVFSHCNVNIPNGHNLQKTFEPILGVETQALIKRAFMFIDDNNFDEAERYFEQALKQDPENSSAYLGKLMIELKVHNVDELSNISSSLREQSLFQRALKFANDEEKIKLERCLEVNIELQYVKALEMKKEINSSLEAQNIINVLTSITQYKDTETLIQELMVIKQKFEGLEKRYSDAWDTWIEKRINVGQTKSDILELNQIADLFASLGDYKDCQSLSKEIRNLAIEQVEQVKKHKKITRIVVIIIVCVICSLLISKFYQSWLERAEQEQIEQARIEAEKNDEKSRIEALKLELKNRK